MSDKPILEICTDSVASCKEAEKGGAARVELCANLFEGGTTPSAGCIQVARKQISIPLHVLIRPRGGDFCYTEDEFAVMRQDVEIAKNAGADGIVIGILRPEGTIDLDRTAALIKQAWPMHITFHRAFDMVIDPVLALQQLIDLGIGRLLTSGQEKSALEGTELIAELVQMAGDKLVIMPGGGITERNIVRIRRETGAREFHLSARAKIASAMTYRNPNAYMGGELRLPEYETGVANAQKIARTRIALTGQA